MELKSFHSDGTKKFFNNGPKGSIVIVLKKFLNDGTEKFP